MARGIIGEIGPDYNLIKFMIEHGRRITVQELEDLTANLVGYGKSNIYRILKYMEEKGICSKEGHYYVLDINWLAADVMRAEQWLENQLKQLNLKELLPEGMDKNTWQFINLKHAYFFLQQIIMSVLYYDKTRIMYVWTQHPWYFFCSDEAETNFNKLLNKWNGVTHRLIGGNTWLDRKYLDKWQMSKSSTFFGEKAFSAHKNNAITIVSNYVISFKMGKKITAAIEEIFDKAEKTEEIDYQLVNSLFNIREKITVEIDRNPIEANRIVRLFEKRKQLETS